MTSSLGDQLSALLGGDTLGSAGPDQGRGKSKGEIHDESLPDGVHGEIAAIIKKMAVDEVKSLGLSTPLADYGFDRLTVVELAIRCEQELGVRIEDEDIASFVKLGDVVDYIAARRG